MSFLMHIYFKNPKLLMIAGSFACPLHTFTKLIIRTTSRMIAHTTAANIKANP